MGSKANGMYELDTDDSSSTNFKDSFTFTTQFFGCTFSQNSAAYGGALYLLFAKLKLTNLSGGAGENTFS